MNPRPRIAFVGAVCLLGALVGLPAMPLLAQDANVPPPPDSTPLIKAEKRLLLVDTVVTDKKGNYIRDLTAKDFRVWEDKKEQSIESFSFEATPASAPNAQNRYLVLFFDNSTLEFADQANARKAALQFIDSKFRTAPLDRDRGFRRKFADRSKLHRR